MGTPLREIRTPVMTVVEVALEDAGGIVYKVPARMEDKSVSGACLRVREPVVVGSTLTVKWRFDEFAGTCKYCRPEGREYLIGIQKEAALGVLERPSLRIGGGPGEARNESTQSKSDDSKKTVANEVHLPTEQETLRDEMEFKARPGQRMHIAPQVPGVPATTEQPGASSGQERDEERKRAIVARQEEFTMRRQSEVNSRAKFAPQAEPPVKGKAVRRERKSTFMGRNWLERTPWHSKQESPSVGGDRNDPAQQNGNHGSEAGAGMINASHKSTPDSLETSLARTSSELDAAIAGVSIDLLPMEEIYRSAGIVGPQKGYSVHKVVEMLHSEHIRGLGPDLKRAAVLMALDAAGVSVEQIEQDARARQGALDRYEAQQTAQSEAEWARKMEENGQVEAELERVKSHYMARINRNLDAVARERSTFNGWLVHKRQEAESMTEALNLCARAPESKTAPPPAPLANAAAAGAGSTSASQAVAAKSN